jgi:NAD(P)-dependent dehydrogenase (short-subunit alcohol dehydrogenase family)
MLMQAIDTWGTLDVLVNNAGPAHSNLSGPHNYLPNSFGFCTALTVGFDETRVIFADE